MSIHKHIILFLRDFYEKNSIFRKTSAASYAVLYHASARIASALSHDVTKCVKENVNDKAPLRIEASLDNRYHN